MAKRKDSENEMKIWKFGCNWGNRQNPSFYEFIKEENIVIGREKSKYSAGDLVLITDGFTVKAIAKVLEEPQPITINDDYIVLTQKYKVTRDDLTIFAKAEWYELPEDKIFQYLSQRGSGKVRKTDIIKTTFEFWNKRSL